MCGIAGAVFTGEGRPPGRLRQIVERMTAAQVHRGPDAGGVVMIGALGMGHRRLSILDLSDDGRQPMQDASGRYTIVYNGEVYNYRPLRDELRRRGYAFRSRTDTEVILNAYAEWGMGCLDRLSGIFAFGLHDGTAGRLLLVRDRFGIKPLYWARPEPGWLLFASEVRALLESGLVDRRLDARALSAFVQYQSVPPPATLVEGVHLLEPGTVLTVDAAAGAERDGERTAEKPISEWSGARVQRRTYWDLLASADPDARTHDAPTARATVRRRLQAAIDEQLVSDVPLGAFLSGGIDSSVVVGLMSEACEAPIRTFTVAFEEADNRDAEYARRVARRYGTRHAEVVLTDDQLVAQAADALRAQDHPSGDGLNTYIVSRAAKEAGLTVALSGVGGDELFAGYDTFDFVEAQQRLRALWRFTPSAPRKRLAQWLEGAAPRRAEKVAALIGTDGTPAQVHALRRRLYSRRRARDLLRGELPAGDVYADRVEAALAAAERRTGARPPLYTQVAFAEARTYMHDVLLRDTDQMGMAHALEIRVPLLDHRLAEYVMGLPDRVKRPRGTPKRLLVEACAGVLPDAVVHRPKQGFALPVARWMCGPLRPLCDEGLAAVAALDAFDGAAVEERWAAFRADPQGIPWPRIWLLVALGHWARRHGLTAPPSALPRAAASRPAAPRPAAAWPATAWPDEAPAPSS